MPEIPRTKFNSPWTVAVIEAALNDVSSAKGSSESLTAALNAMRAEINSLSGGVHLKGAVDYYNDLPASPSEGDAYTVRYQGTSGTDPLGIEYAWATYQGTPQWIPIGVDPSVFAKATDEAEDRAALIEVENKGAKNLLEITRVSQTIDGVTFTVNDDGTVTIDTAGVTSQNRAQFLLRSVTTYPGMQGCVLSGAVQNNQDVQLRFQLGDNPWTVYASDSGSGATISSYSDASLIQVYINVPAGSTVSNLVFKPMICTKAEWAVSQKFVPYCPTNRELYEKVDGLGTELVANTNLNNLNIGTYYCGGATIGVTLLNSPTRQPFRLTVSYFQSSTNMMQKIIDFNTSTSEITIYIRVKTSSGWKSWYKFEGTEVT